MNKNLISIIVPVYNSEKYLRKCLNSIINQTYRNIEIILIDDGSLDKSGEICDEYAKKDNRIIVIHKKNEGVSAARNTGLDVATGSYISFIDSDDYIDCDLYTKCMEILQKQNADMIKFQYYKTRQDGKVFSSSSNSLVGFISLKDNNNVFELIIKNNEFPNCWGIIYNYDIIKNLRYNQNLTVAEDWLFVFEAFCKANNIYVLENPLYYYIYNNNSITHELNIAKMKLKLVDHYNVEKYVAEKYLNDKNLYYYKDLVYSNTYNITKRYLNVINTDCTFKHYKKFVQDIKINEEFLFFYNTNFEWKNKYDKIFNTRKLEFYIIKLIGNMKKIIKKLIIDIG